MTDFIYNVTPSDQTCLICLAGPTASGKSDLAMTFAQNSKDTVIINADSCQIFQELQILTARPQICEMMDIPHMFYGHIPLTAQYSVQHWCQEVSVAIQDIIARGGRVILVGGTGLYFHSLLNGIAPIPDIDPDIRDAVRQMSGDDLYAALQKEDPIAAQKFHKNDTQRIARALEVVRSTHYPISYWHKNTQSFLPPNIQCESFALMPDRDALYDRIDRRFDLMMEMGALEEAQRIKTLLSEDDIYKNIVHKIVGLSELISYLDGDMTCSEAILKAKQSSGNYAKRQMTWFRNKGNFNLIANI